MRKRFGIENGSLPTAVIISQTIQAWFSTTYSYQELEGKPFSRHSHENENEKKFQTKTKKKRSL